MWLGDSNFTTIDGVQTRTMVGAFLTMCSAMLVLVLVITELRVYTSLETVHHITVDNKFSAVDDFVHVKLAATFFHLPCDDVNLDLEATRGDEIEGSEPEVVKTPFKDEGCSIQGNLKVAKVGGNFHLATGKLGGGLPLIQLSGGVFTIGGGSMKGANLSHTIHHLSFGDKFPGLTDPLQDVTNIVPMDVGQYQFHIKIVPTLYRALGKTPKFSNQYSLSEQFVRLDLLTAMQTGSAPGIYFYYDFYPVMIEYHEKKPGFLQFLTRVCGIIGGVFTVAGVFDGIFHRANETLKKKE
jgi:hypothetical protein